MKKNAEKKVNAVNAEEAGMTRYQDLSVEELESLRKELKQSYREYQNMDLNLDMSRGKPSLDQLDLSNGMMDALTVKPTCIPLTDLMFEIMAFWAVLRRQRNCSPI